MIRLISLILLAFGAVGIAAAAPDSSTVSSSASATSTNVTSTYGSSYGGSYKYKYKFSNKYCGYGWHKPPKHKVVYKTCKKWKRNHWWWGYNRKGHLVKYVCKPHKPASP